MGSSRDPSCVSFPVKALRRVMFKVPPLQPAWLGSEPLGHPVKVETEKKCDCAVHKLGYKPARKLANDRDSMMKCQKCLHVRHH